MFDNVNWLLQSVEHFWYIQSKQNRIWCVNSRKSDDSDIYGQLESMPIQASDHHIAIFWNLFQIVHRLHRMHRKLQIVSKWINF